jgi:hypothetical protein
MQKNDDRSLITFPTWKKYIVISCYIEGLRVKEKRQLFHIMRRHSSILDHNSFFPLYGITAGEFAVWQVLSESRKSRRRES